MTRTQRPFAARASPGPQAAAPARLLPSLVDQALQAVPIDRVMHYLGQVTEYDRYQASEGIEAAAMVVADAARAIGLRDVEVERFPADGKADRWWTFQAPLAWTPRVAWIEVRTAGGAALRIEHAQLPFSIATYSAATPAGGIRSVLVRVAGNWRPFKGAVVLLDSDELVLPDVMPRLAELGAAGFISASAGSKGADGQHAARIELPVRTSLFGFSVTPAQYDMLCDWATTGASVHAVVDIDGSASMPVVSGIIPGASTEEIWLTAHLCHPRPGANDNASGVAALLGIAESLLTLTAAHTGRVNASKTVRFLWCPEFVGTAAALHRRIAGTGRVAHPHAVINLDMVGEDQRLCGSSFVLERPPETRPSLLAAIAESVIEEVFVQSAASGGEWRSMPFHGYSDHALFAGPGLGCPAIQLTHWPDRFNHTAADTLDKVSPVEMIRSTAIGTVLAQLARGDAILPAQECVELAARWRVREAPFLRAAQERQYDLAHSDWADELAAYFERQCAQLMSVLDQPYARRFEPEGQPLSGAVRARWAGPINLKAMACALPSARRSVLEAMISADKRTLALLANYCARSDGRRTRTQIIAETSFALRRPTDGPQSEWLFDTLSEAGWIEVT